MNGQTPPRRKRPTRPDMHPTETPRPTRRKTASTGAAKPKASRPKSPPASEATTPAPVPVLPDRAGDVSAAINPRQLAFFALIAALIVAVLRRLLGRRRGAG
jgi:hypothetical protein